MSSRHATVIENMNNAHDTVKMVIYCSYFWNNGFCIQVQQNFCCNLRLYMASICWITETSRNKKQLHVTHQYRLTPTTGSCHTRSRRCLTLDPTDVNGSHGSAMSQTCSLSACVGPWQVCGWLGLGFCQRHLIQYPYCIWNNIVDPLTDSQRFSVSGAMTCRRTNCKLKSTDLPTSPKLQRPLNIWKTPNVQFRAYAV